MDVRNQISTPPTAAMGTIGLIDIAGIRSTGGFRQRTSFQPYQW